MDTWHAEIMDWMGYLLATGTPKTTLSVRRHHMFQVSEGVGGKPWNRTLDDYINWLAGRDWAPNTRRSYRTTLRAFYAWGMATGRTAHSPAHLIPPVRVPRGKPRPTPESIYRAALAQADDRTALAIRLAAQCGLRRSEVARVRGSDVQETLLGRALRVTGKGGHVRIVPLPDDLADVIEPAGDRYVFPSPLGGHLTPHHLSKLVSKCMPDGWTTHTLRHRCGSVSYSATKDLRAVQELLGHAKPETTALYTAVPDDTIRAAMMAAAA